MPFKPGVSGNPAGKPPGALNKTTQLLKDAILLAAQKAGNGDMAAYLEQQARNNPGPFLALLGKVLPMQMTGIDDGALQINVTIGGHDNRQP